MMPWFVVLLYSTHVGSRCCFNRSLIGGVQRLDGNAEIAALDIYGLDIDDNVNRQWITKRSIGPEHLRVRDNRSRTNNVLESFHAALRRCIKVSHPNLYAFLSHLQLIR